MPTNPRKTFLVISVGHRGVPGLPVLRRARRPRALRPLPPFALRNLRQLAWPVDVRWGVRRIDDWTHQCAS